MEAFTGQTPGAINPKAADISLGFVPGLTVGGLNVVGLTSLTGGLDAPNIFAFHWTSFQWYTDATPKRGRHSIVLGAAVERMRDNMSTTSALHGGYTFQSLQEFLTNRPFFLNVELSGSSGDRGLRQTVLGSYVQDDVHVSSSLTLNLGLRYELATVPVDVRGRLAALQQQRGSRLQVCRSRPSPRWKRIRQEAPSETPAIIPKGGESRCQPMPAPGVYSVIKDSDNRWAGMPAIVAARVRSGSKEDGNSDSIAAEPAYSERHSGRCAAWRPRRACEMPRREALRLCSSMPPLRLPS